MELVDIVDIFFEMFKIVFNIEEFFGCEGKIWFFEVDVLKFLFEYNYLL